ncbi:PepSY domain-containing protein [Bacillus sp. J33]|uniref:PepSY domain-containing protein n=1 Tax=Bacillus sp. J33 TaxID=935836 RepID=UPI00047D8353|nr:PepSY domain-containing protein [Bacillus sp. J33]
MNKKLLVLSLSGAILLGGAAAAGADSIDDRINSSKKQEELISLEEAKKIALSKADGQVESIEMERDNGQKYYDIDIEAGDLKYDIHVEAITGKVLSFEKDWDGNDKGIIKDKIISEQKAIETAEKEVNGTVKEIEREEDDGKVIYEIELNTNKGEADVNIEASTGKVLSVEYDD